MNNENIQDPILMNPQYVHKNGRQDSDVLPVQKDYKKTLTQAKGVQNEEQYDRRKELQRKGYNFDPDTGEYIGITNNQDKISNVPNEQSKPSMKWFKFIIYFQLFFNAFLNLCLAASYATGRNQGEYAEYLYEYYGIGLKICDMSFAGIYALIAICAIFVRFSLAKYRKHAPMSYLALWGVSAIVPVIYLVTLAIVIPEVELIWDGALQGVITNSIWIIVNYFYFKKRKHMFLNN